jgi:hypothetical protein
VRRARFLRLSRKNRRRRGYAEWRPQRKSLELLADVQEVLDRYGEHLPLTIRQVVRSPLAQDRRHRNRARRAAAGHQGRDRAPQLTRSPRQSSIRRGARSHHSGRPDDAVAGGGDDPACQPVPAGVRSARVRGRRSAVLFNRLKLALGHLEPITRRWASPPAVIGWRHARRDAVEFKKFLLTLDREVRAGLEVHLMVDSASTHSAPAVRRWLAARRRLVLQPTPTCGA